MGGVVEAIFVIRGGSRGHREEATALPFFPSKPGVFVHRHHPRLPLFRKLKVNPIEASKYFFGIFCPSVNGLLF